MVRKLPGSFRKYEVRRVDPSVFVTKEIIYVEARNSCFYILCEVIKLLT
jgi:hypothetical protein